MPHPVQPAPLPAQPSSPPSPPLQPFHPALLAQAHALALRSFEDQVKSVLRFASITFLRRSLSQRVRDHFRRLPREQLTGSSTEELLRSEPDLLLVSEEDVARCYGVAERVGRRWAEVLLRRGYREFAEIASSLAKEGRFLEIPAEPAESSSSGHAGIEKRLGETGKYASPHTALHALRRYPPDCDGSGLPSKHLPVLDYEGGNGNMQSDGQKSSARKVIDQIDEMARSGETNWQHGWDAIEEAAKRNKKRMESSRLTVGTERYEIVPKQDIAADLLKHGDGHVEEGNEEAAEASAGSAEEGADSRHLLKRGDDDGEEGNDKNAEAGAESEGERAGSHPAKKRVKFKDDDGSPKHRAADIDFLLSTNKKAVRILTKRRRQEEEAAEGGKESNENTDHQKMAEARERGRPASSMGEETLSWEDVLRSMAEEERRRLIESAIHPPHPFESGAEGAVTNAEEEPTSPSEDPPHNAVITGALKEFGQIHLWEQTRDLPEIEDGEIDDKGGEWDDAGPIPSEEGREGRKGEKEVIYGASEARASFLSRELGKRKRRVLRKATRERLGRRVLSTSEIKGGYARCMKCTKVRWTEDDPSRCADTESMESHVLTDAATPRWYELSDEPRQWLEMDLGECTIELVDDEEQTEAGKGGNGKGEKNRRFLAFRSLELALLR